MDLSTKRRNEARRVIASQLSEYDKGRLCRNISEMSESELDEFSTANTTEEMSVFLDRSVSLSEDDLCPMCCFWFWPWSW